MLTATAHGRLGRDVELRYTPEGKAVAELALACNYGRKDKEGKYPTQWVRATVWDKQAEALAPHLTKGTGLVLILRDVNVREYQSERTGKGYALEGVVIGLEFAAGQPAERSAAPAQRQQAPQRQAPAPQSRGSTGFDDMDDDIPF